MKEKVICNLRTCPMFIGLFLEGQKQSGLVKEEMNKLMIKWFKAGKKVSMFR